MSLSFKAMAFARLVQRTVVSALIVSLLCLPAYGFGWGHHHHSAPQLVVEGQPVLFTVLPTVDRDHVFSSPVDFVHLLGANFAVASGSDTLTVTGADGRTITVSYTRDDDRCVVDVAKVAQGLGAVVDWDEKTSTLTLRAKVLAVHVENGNLHVQTSYPVNYSTGALSNPPRIYVDVAGAVLPTSPTTVSVQSDGVDEIRSKQLDSDTVRIALDMTHTARVAPGPSEKSSDIQVALTISPRDIAAPANTAVASAPPVAATALPVVSAPPIPTTLTGVPAPVGADNTPKVTGITSQVAADGKLQIVVATTGSITDTFATNTFDKTADRPDRFALDLPASLAVPKSIGDGQMAVADSEVKSVRWGVVHTDGKPFARIVLDLASPQPYHVTATPAPGGDGTLYMIEPGVGDAVNPPPTVVITPGSAVPTEPHGNGSIKGMLIVVDPGHGGKDTGAPGVDGLFEKNLTLAIGKDVRDALVEAGANVLMTRQDDTFIPLSTRSQIAIDNNADYFISIHCDSGSSRNAQEGSTVYYHGNNVVCKTLAMCIASRFNEANLGIKSDSVRTDYVRFPGSGFSVLRRAGEPAVLCECGYVNNDNDAKALSDSTTQKLIAASIVAGLKDFVGNKVASR